MTVPGSPLAAAIGGNMSPRMRSGLGVALLVLVLVIIMLRAWLT
jgi:hypothetical protein